MASTTLNAKNLQALGVERLADLLIEISTGNAAAKRQLRFELAGQNGPAEVAREVRKRLSTIARSTSFIDWHRHRALVADLQTQRKAIAETIGPSDPDEAVELLWRLIDLAPGLYDRADDSSGAIGDVFRDAVIDFGTVATKAKAEPESLAARIFGALCANDYAQYDGLIEALAPALAERGLAALKARFLELQSSPCRQSWLTRIAAGVSSDENHHHSQDRSRPICPFVEERTQDEILRGRRRRARGFHRRAGLKQNLGVEAGAPDDENGERRRRNTSVSWFAPIGPPDDRRVVC